MVVEDANVVEHHATQSVENIAKCHVSHVTCHSTLIIWHERLGHMNRRPIQQMAQGIGVTGMRITTGFI